MRRSALFLAALLVSATVHAAPVVVVPAGRSQSTKKEPEPYVNPGRTQPACMWQVPGYLQWVNLSHAYVFGVSTTREGHSFYLRTDPRAIDSLVNIKLQSGEDLARLPSLVQARLEECGAR